MPSSMNMVMSGLNKVASVDDLGDYFDPPSPERIQASQPIQKQEDEKPVSKSPKQKAKERRQRLVDAFHRQQQNEANTPPSIKRGPSEDLPGSYLNISDADRLEIVKEDDKIDEDAVSENKERPWVSNLKRAAE